MLGKLKFQRRLPTLPITLASVFIALLLLLVFIYAARDIFLTARKKDESASRATLTAELSDFRMATRTENNESLFDDPLQFSSTNRPLKVTVLNKSFFTYLLHSGNARSIEAETLEWEAPEACVTRFPVQKATPKNSKYGLEGCLSSLRNDPTGSFLYFSLRYPSDAVVRHKRGQKPTSADFIKLDFQGQHSTSIYLVFETPVLAERRYPSQISRFTGIHEVTGYSVDGTLIRTVNAQAFERHRTYDGVERSYVTVVGRLDATRVGIQLTDNWPNSEVSQIKTGVIIAHAATPGEPSDEIFNLSADTRGVAKISVEQAYNQNVRSRSNVDVFRLGKLIWSSSSLETPGPRTHLGLFQKLSDFWASNVISPLTGSGTQPIRLEQKFGVDGQLTATIVGTPYLTDDIAARAFLWFSFGFILISVLGIIWVAAILRLRRIAVAAAEMAFRPSLETNLKNFAEQRDEIGTLAKIIDVLVRRTRSRHRRTVQRNMLELEELDQRTKLRQSILEAIGHEIKSPLQSLLSLNIELPEVAGNLERMNRAVQALYFAASVEAGLKSGRISVETEDIAEYLASYASNKAEQGVPIKFKSATTAVFAKFDPISLDQVLEHIVDNAERLRRLHTGIEILLTRDDSFVSIAITNRGSRIEGDVEAIFLFGNTTAAPSTRNRGQGLFVARVLMHGMGGSIAASNIDDGVQLLLKLSYVPRSPS